MAKNVGQIDRFIRFIIGVVLAVLFFTDRVNGALGVILLIVAAIMVVTSLAGSCPAYSIFGISTCKKS